MHRLTKNNGTYLLELKLETEFKLSTSKKFKDELLLPGYYYYSGSAQKNLMSRITRHVKPTKKVHWHIDHITTNNAFKWNSVIVFPEARRDFECEVVKQLLKEGRMLLKNFGNGDCDLCETHLIYKETPFNQSHLLSLYQSAVLLTPSSSDIFGL